MSLTSSDIVNEAYREVQSARNQSRADWTEAYAATATASALCAQVLAIQEQTRAIENLTKALTSRSERF